MSTDQVPVVPPPPAAVVGQYRAYFYGLTPSLILYGLMISQAWTFYHLPVRGSRHRFVQLFVTFLISGATVTTGMHIAILDYFLIEKAGNFTALGDVKEYRTILISMLFFVLNMFAVQTFFAYQVWSVTGMQQRRAKFSIPIVIAIIVLAFSALSSTMVGFITGWINPASAREKVGTVSVCIATVSNTLCDMLASIYLSIFLRQTQSGVRKTTQIVKSIVFFALQRAILVAVLQMLVFIFTLALPNQLLWFTLDMYLSKLYVNTTLAMLNARGKFSSEVSTTGAISLSGVVTNPPTARSPHKRIPDHMDIHISTQQTLQTDSDQTFFQDSKFQDSKSSGI